MPISTAIRPRLRTLPDLPTPIGLAGTMRHAGAAGGMSLDVAVTVAIVAFSLAGR